MRGKTWTPERWQKMNPRTPLQYAPGNANLGGVGAFGWLWPCCPRFFDKFASDAASAEAEQIIDLVWWLEQGALSAVVEPPLSAGTAYLVKAAFGMIATFRADYQEHKRKLASEKAKRDAARANKMRKFRGR